jgi:hypothetical protein
MSTLIHAEFEVAQCDALFLVNDIPVGQLQHRRSARGVLPIHEFLQAGRNTLAIVRLDAVADGAPGGASGDSGAPADAPPAASAFLAITAWQAGQMPGTDPGRPVTRLEFKADPAAAPATTSPAPRAPSAANPTGGNNPASAPSPPVAQGDFSLPSWPQRWAWQDATALDWHSPKARQAVWQFVQEFAQRFQQGDAAWVAGVLYPKMSEYCQAYGLDLRTERAELEARMARRQADPSFALTPLAEADLQMRPWANGRLVEPQRSDGSPAIRWKDARAGARGAMPLRLGLVERRLLVLR